MNYAAACNTAVTKLMAAQVPEAKENALLLLEHICGSRRQDLYLDPGRVLTRDEEDKYFDLIDKRCARIPLQLLTGTAYGMYAPEGSYVLQKQNEQLGFFRVNESSKIRVGAGKAYLTLPVTASASPYRAFVFDSDYVNGITTLSDDSLQFVYVYGLTGELLLTIDKGALHGNVEQRILQSLGHGIFIVRDGNSSRKVVM